MKCLLALLATLLLTGVALGQATSTRSLRWEQLGPMPGAAPSTLHLAETPADPLRLYATARGGFLVSEDAGLTWEMRPPPRCDRVPYGSVAASPVDADVVLYSPGYGDLFRSNDAGRTWTLVLARNHDYGLGTPLFAPSDSMRVYVSSYDGFWRSTDGGYTFEQLLDGILDTGGWGYGVLVDHADPLHAYYHVMRVGLYETLDGGDSFEIKPYPSGWSGLSIAIDPNDGDRLLLGQRGICRSDDGGDTWSSRGSGVDRYVDAVAFDAWDPGRCYAGVRDTGLAVSDDDGDSWSLLSDPVLDHEPPNYLTILASVPTSGMVLAAGNGGILRSTDFAASFTRPTSDLARHATAYDVVVDPFTAGHLVARTSRTVYCSEDGGLNWFESTGLTRFGGYEGGFAADPLTPGRYYAAAHTGQVYRSDDGGRTFSLRSDIGSWVIQVAPHPTIVDRVFITTPYSPDSGVLRSDDGGDTFVPTGAPDIWTWALAISPVDPDLMYCSTSDGVMYSSDGGLTWIVPASQPPPTIRCIRPDPLRRERAWTTTPWGGLYRTDDGGVTWTAMASGFDFASTLAIPPTNPDLVIANHTLHPSGWVSRDPASRCVRLGFGLTSPILGFDLGNEEIHAGTASSGVWVLR